MSKKESKPRIYLFFSVDIVDSTRFKNNPKENWYAVFRSFYKEFPASFEKEIDRNFQYYEIRLKSHKEQELRKALIWKYVGDEILLYTEITEENEVPVFVRAFWGTLENWQDPKNNKKIPLKGTVWLGQVPFIDRMFDGENGKIDFIGPSIDCGFRIAKFADKRKLMLSIDVVSLCIDFPDLKGCFYFDGSEALKGIEWTKEYPLFFLSVGDKSTLEETYLLEFCRERNVRNYLNAFYDEAKTVTKNISRVSSDIISYLKSKQTDSVKIVENDEGAVLMGDSEFADEKTVVGDSYFAEFEADTKAFRESKTY